MRIPKVSIIGSTWFVGAKATDDNRPGKLGEHKSGRGRCEGVPPQKRYLVNAQDAVDGREPPHGLMIRFVPHRILPA
jgi:hypothetical protein